MIKVNTTGQVPEVDIEGFLQAFAEEFVKRVQVRTPVKSGALQNGYNITDITQDGFGLTNSQTYFDFVENGTVKQSPQYMVRTTVEESELIAKAVADKLVKKG